MTTEQIDDYLWNRTGDGDEQLRGLEELLAGCRLDRAIRPLFDQVDADDDDERGDQ